MASKKDFSQLNTGRVYGAIDEATADTQQEQQAQEAQHTRKPRKTYTEEEAQEIKLAGKTQGRKGCKAVRVNMAFAPDLYEYIRTMSRMRGESITEFTNYVFRNSMTQNADLFAQAQRFKDEFKD